MAPRRVSFPTFRWGLHREDARVAPLAPARISTSPSDRSHVIMKFRLLVFLLVLAPATGLHARVDFLLVPPNDAVPGEAGLVFTLYLNNPTPFDETVEFPQVISADYSSSTGRHRTQLQLAETGDLRCAVPALSRRTVKLVLREPLEGANGFVSLRLLRPETNSIMFELQHPAALASATPPEAAAPAPAQRTALKPGHHLDLTTDLENMRRHISGYEPIYFAVGSRARLNARFQFSFKYRVFEPATSGDPWYAQLARDLHAAYSQTTIWDLETFSKPFYDSSYRPTIFLEHTFRPEKAVGWRFTVNGGVQHESNGKGGAPDPATDPAPADSRSLNTLYFGTTLRWSDDRGRFFEAGARASSYFQVDENPDIARYRGYVALKLRGGYDRGFQLATELRGHPSGYGSVEFDASWPAIETPLLKLILPHSLGGYALVQYFNGYGESLLDYNVRRKDQLRFGIMIVR